MGVFPDLPADGEGRASSPAICQATGPILDLKTAFAIPRLELSENIVEFYGKVTDDVTDYV